MKRSISCVVLAMLLLTALLTGTATAGVSATRSISKVTVDGTITQFDAYNVQGNNYFKLRDLAAAFHGSDKQFEVTWDGEAKAIRILRAQAYTPVGGELLAGEGEDVKAAVPTTAKLFCDGESIQLEAYNIAGNNYVKLRALAELVDFGVGYDATTKTIALESKSHYIANLDLEQRVLDLVNIERSKEGLSPVTWCEDLAVVAREHSKDMALSNFFEHDNLKGETPFDRMERHGVQFTRASENIAAGQSTPERVMEDWMKSPGHRQNILDPDVTELGVGYYYQADSAYKAYWTQNFRHL